MTTHKKQLSPTRQRFLELMQKLNFCQFLGLQLRDGEPVFDPPPVIVQNVKIGGNNDARIEIHAQVVLCPQINDGEVLRRTINDLAAQFVATTDGFQPKCFWVFDFLYDGGGTGARDPFNFPARDAMMPSGSLHGFDLAVINPAFDRRDADACQVCCFFGFQ